MKQQTCCFTGHRNIPPEHIPVLEKQLRAQILQLFDDGYRIFACGGALGFDTMAAQAVLELRDRGLPLQLLLILPCADQDALWSAEDRRTYRDILRRANEVECIAAAYYDGCMQKRNRTLAERSSCCVCYCRRLGSGTGYTMRYARQLGLRIEPLSGEEV